MYAFVRFLNIPVVAEDGEEADDVIASYVHAASTAQHFVRIVARDKDLLQLVRGDDVLMFDWLYGELWGERKAFNLYRLPPQLIPDAQCLVGDRVDNVPGTWMKRCVRVRVRVCACVLCVCVFVVVCLLWFVCLCVTMCDCVEYECGCGYLPLSLLICSSVGGCAVMWLCR